MTTTMNTLEIYFSRLKSRHNRERAALAADVSTMVTVSIDMSQPTEPDLHATIPLMEASGEGFHSMKTVLYLKPILQPMKPTRRKCWWRWLH